MQQVLPDEFPLMLRHRDSLPENLQVLQRQFVVDLLVMPSKFTNSLRPVPGHFVELILAEMPLSFAGDALLGFFDEVPDPFQHRFSRAGESWHFGIIQSMR